MRRSSWTLVGVLVTLGCPAEAKPPALMLGPPKAGLKLRAHRLNYLPKSGKIKLSGNVALTTGKLSLRADRLVLRLDRKTQRPSSASAHGSVVLTRDAMKATASSVSLVLFGDGKTRPTAELVEARVTRSDGLTVQGKRIYLDLGTGAIVVHQATASIPGQADDGG